MYVCVMEGVTGRVVQRVFVFVNRVHESTHSQSIYRVRHVVVDLGWVDFIFNIPSSCPAPQPILPNFQLPRQSRAGSGTPKISVNPT